MIITAAPIVAADRPRLLALLELQTNFNRAEVEVAVELIDDVLNNPRSDYRILQALTAVGQLAGFICFGPIPLTEQSYDLYWIAVDPARGRQGVGRFLLQRMEEQVKAAVPGARIYVDTSSTPSYAPARAFYRKHGYVAACVLADFYRPGDDKVIFVKAVAPTAADDLQEDQGD